MRHPRHILPLACAPLAALAVPPASSPVADLSLPTAGDTEPVVLTGADLPDWAVPATRR